MTKCVICGKESETKICIECSYEIDKDSVEVERNNEIKMNKFLETQQ